MTPDVFTPEIILLLNLSQLALIYGSFQAYPIKYRSMVEMSIVANETLNERSDGDVDDR